MIVVKYGGHALPKAGTPDGILQIVANYHKSGREILLVHGGGPQVDVELAIHGIKSEMVNGYRVTTPEIIEVVQAVLAGQVCRTLVNQLVSYGANAVGLSATDGGTIRAEIMKPIVNGEAIDIGLVGDIASTNPAFLKLLIEEKYLPVISPVAVNSEGQALNVNGDLAAAAIGGAMRADQVIFMTDVEGIYRNYPDRSSIINECSAQELRALQPSFSAGMIPKSKAALLALNMGARLARVIDGRDPANLIAALDGVGGTVVTR